MKLRLLRIVQILLCIVWVGLVIAQWYQSNDGFSTKERWFFVPIVLVALLMKFLHSRNRCPYCKGQLDYKRQTHCPHCKEPL